MISASHEDKATVACFLDDQEIAAELNWKIQNPVAWKNHN